MRITLAGKLKHTDLYEAAKKVGSQASLARLLDVSQSQLGLWCNLRACPPISPSKHWPQERIRRLEKQLYDLTGKTLDELFPPELRENQKFLDADKWLEETRDIDFLRLANNTKERLTLPCPVDVLQKKEEICNLRKVLKTLSPRLRELLKMRYGIDYEFPLTFEELGYVFKVTRERARVLVARAEHMLASHLKILHPSDFDDFEKV